MDILSHKEASDILSHQTYVEAICPACGAEMSHPLPEWVYVAAFAVVLVLLALELSI